MHFRTEKGLNKGSGETLLGGVWPYPFLTSKWGLPGLLWTLDLHFLFFPPVVPDCPRELDQKGDRPGRGLLQRNDDLSQSFLVQIPDHPPPALLTQHWSPLVLDVAATPHCGGEPISLTQADAPGSDHV